MKTKIYSLTLIAAAALTLGSCSDEWNKGEGPDATEYGQLSKHSIDVVNAEIIIPTGSRAGYDTSNFIVTIRNSEGAQVGQWTYAKMPELVSLPVGTGYSVSVYSHQQEKAAWDAPYFENEPQTFDIKANEITEVGTVTCKMANIKVSIKYSPDLKAAFGDDCKVTVIANDEGRLEFLPDEIRSGYFQAVEGSSTLVATLSGTIDGSPAEVRTVLSDVEAGQHRIITYSFKGGNPTPPDENGYFDPETGIHVDFDVIDETVEGGVDVDEDIIKDPTRPGQEDPEEDPGQDPDDPNNPDNPDNPDDAVATFESFNSPKLKLDVVNNANDFGDGDNAIVRIGCPAGFKNLVVTISTDSDAFVATLKDMGLYDPFDLANPGDLEATLGDEGLGLPTGAKVVGQTSVDFNISQFVPLLLIYPGAHNFVLEVVDNNGQKANLTLRFTAN